MLVCPSVSRVSLLVSLLVSLVMLVSAARRSSPGSSSAWWVLLYGFVFVKVRGVVGRSSSASVQTCGGSLRRVSLAFSLLRTVTATRFC